MNHLSKVIVMSFIFAFLFFITSDSGYAGDVDKGKEVYKKLCVLCHGPDGHSRYFGVPDFSKGERLEKDRTELMTAVKKEHRQSSPTVPMPSLEDIYSDVELDDVMSYILTLKK